MATSAQLRAAQRRLRAIPGAVKDAVMSESKVIIDEMAEMMRRGAPEDQGDLIDSIQVTPPGGTTPMYSQPGGNRTVPENQYVLTVGNDEVRYPHMIEYGVGEHSVSKGAGTALGKMKSRLTGSTGTQHPGHEAQPFFWPVVRLTKKKSTSRMKRVMKKAVEGTYK